MDDLNDVRIALGTLVHATRHISDQLDQLGERVDQLAPVAGAVDRVDQLAGDMEAMVALVPTALRQAAAEPPLNMLAGERLEALADDMERSLAARRAGAELVGEVRTELGG